MALLLFFQMMKLVSQETIPVANVLILIPDIVCVCSGTQKAEEKST